MQSLRSLSSFSQSRFQLASPNGSFQSMNRQFGSSSMWRKEKSVFVDKQKEGSLKEGKSKENAAKEKEKELKEKAKAKELKEKEKAKELKEKEKALKEKEKEKALKEKEKNKENAAKEKERIQKEKAKELKEKELQKKREEKELSKAKPKRPPTARNFFSKETFPALYKQHNDFAKTSSQVSTMWNALSPQQKKKYEDLAATAKKDYGVAKGEFEKKYSKPKAVNAYSLFVKENHGSSVGNTFQEKSKYLSQQWKSFDESKKKKYVDLAEKANKSINDQD
eukprot:TRINITY_DN148_c0_g1_i2.p1 TRINITY_DN148_c0_g1~~TRINITY_DN148_c0_g1_i2.p1  ORF type:complete len:280 (+),score=164.25 TRINITY_DN148_c0_g1_i2:134-973(+)